MKTLKEHLLNESDIKYYKNVKITHRNSRSVKGFNQFSGIKYSDALKFLYKVIDLTKFEGVAELFYSGYAGWTLYDNNGKELCYLMYNCNQYGLEDATWGKGWYCQIKTNNPTSEKIESAIDEISSKYNKPKRPRM